MGGAAGHLQHVFEDRTLTFAGLEDIITRLCDGKLSATEKVDASNLMYTFDTDVKVARSLGDIRASGLNEQSLARRFGTRKDIAASFIDGFNVLRRALRVLPPAVHYGAFRGGRRWYSAEIVHPTDFHTIRYDVNAVVFHEWPTFDCVDGHLKEVDGSAAIARLVAHMETMRGHVPPSWSLFGPIAFNGNAASAAFRASLIERLALVRSMSGVESTATILDHLRVLEAAYVKGLCLSAPAASALLERSIGAPNAPGIPDVKAMVNKASRHVISTHVAQAENRCNQWIEPIRTLLDEALAGVTHNVHSALITDGKAEVERLKRALDQAIVVVRSKGDDPSIEALDRELARLGPVSRLSTTLEGIVFKRGGRAYKMTGRWAPAHQIITLARKVESGR